MLVPKEFDHWNDLKQMTKPEKKNTLALFSVTLPTSLLVFWGEICMLKTCLFGFFMWALPSKVLKVKRIKAKMTTFIGNTLEFRFSSLNPKGTLKAIYKNELFSGIFVTAVKKSKKHGRWDRDLCNKEMAAHTKKR